MAGVLWVLTVVATVAGVVVGALNGFPLGFDPWGLMAAGAVIIGSLGALVASRRPANAIGWLMIWMGLLDATAAFGLHFASELRRAVITTMQPGSGSLWLADSGSSVSRSEAKGGASPRRLPVGSAGTP